jgi:hypothetical protein
MKKLILFISALLFFLCVSSFGMAFDNHRRGFIIGGIGGGAIIIWNERIDDVKSDNEIDPALHTDFRIGGGFKGDKFMLYYWNVVNWFVIEEWSGEKTPIMSGVTGAGMSYYFKPTSPSSYINCGIGVAGWKETIETDSEFWWGPGFMVGLGYEFKRHWSVELGIMWGDASTSYNGGTEYHTRTLAITLSIIGIAY